MNMANNENKFSFFSNFIPVLGGIADTVLGGIFGNHAQKQEISAQKEMQQAQFKQQEYLIDKMNQYNLPTNQMKRYRDAGINPYAILGGLSSGNQSSSGSAPGYPSRVPSGYRDIKTHFGDAMQAFLGVQQQKSNIDLSTAQKNVADAQAKKIDAERRGIEQDNINRELETIGNRYILENIDGNLFYENQDDKEYISTRIRKLVHDIAINNLLSRLLKQSATALIDSSVLGKDASFYYAKLFNINSGSNLPIDELPEGQATAILDVKRKLAQTRQEIILSDYQESLILASLTSTAVSNKLKQVQTQTEAHRRDILYKEVKLRYDVYNYILQRERWNTLNAEQQNKILQATAKILDEKANLAGLNEILNSVSKIVELPSDFFSGFKSQNRSINNTTIHEYH
ncbi:DNA pilot protein [Microvirus mar5]|uniref:DNA pilot protein n=1 Tax=Microvirus mar5 TaxID=2851185 RepID=A0A8F5RCN4_9VIRU|nr:DNA pilot protein [Microvirus mar5]